MDPLSAVSGAFQIAQVTTQTIHNLAILRGRYKHADLTIRSLIGELSTIKSAVMQLDDWTRTNTNTSTSNSTSLSLSPGNSNSNGNSNGNGNPITGSEYGSSLTVALDGCRAVMDVLGDEVNALAQSTADGTVVGFRTRVKVVWNEDVMRDHQARLQAQVLALQLLVQACHW